ncbi:MAG: SLC13 family permease [Candidatus Nanopelagicales bacterium]
MMIFAAILVIATLIAMASGRVPPVLALGCAIAIAAITGLAPVDELFSGPSNGGVITVAGMLVIARGVIFTGVVSRITWRLLATVTTAQQALRRLIVPVGVLSATINTTPIVAMLIPASQELQQTRGIPTRQVLLPFAHATTLAGSVTLIGTSSNLLIAGIASSAGVGVGLFSFALIALPVCLIGWLVLMITAPRMFKAGETVEPATKRWRAEIKVADGANAIGRSAATLGIESTQEYELIAVRRHHEDLSPLSEIQAGDTMVFATTKDGVTALWGSPRFGLSAQRLYAASVASGYHGTVRELAADGALTVIAARTDRPLRDTPASAGQTCYVTAEDPNALADSSSVALWQNVAGKAPQPAKTGAALAILLAVIIAAGFGLTSVEVVAFAGALLMVVAQVLTPREAARALDWNVLFILAGSVGLGAIVVSSGLAAKIADAISYLGGGSLPLVIIVIAVTTAALTNITTNAAAASILTPVTIGIADEMGLSPVMLLALVATCISFTFLNPFSHQSNIMVLGPGGYSNTSFVRFGIPLFIVSVVSVCGVAYLLLR